MEVHQVLLDYLAVDAAALPAPPPGEPLPAVGAALPAAPAAVVAAGAEVGAAIRAAVPIGAALPVIMALATALPLSLLPSPPLSQPLLTSFLPRHAALRRLLLSILRTAILVSPVAFRANNYCAPIFKLRLFS